MGGGGGEMNLINPDNNIHMQVNARTLAPSILIKYTHAKYKYTRIRSASPPRGGGRVG